MAPPPATPEQWLRAFEAAVRARDFAGGRAMFADDAVAFGTWAGAVTGLDNIVREQWQNVWPRIRDFRFDADARVRAGGDSAWIAAGWLTEARDPMAVRSPAPAGAPSCWLGQLSTRTIPTALGEFKSSDEAWMRRVQSGQAAPLMLNPLVGPLGGAPFKYFGDCTDRIAKGELPPSKSTRPQGVERNVVVTTWEWGDPKTYLHDLIASDRRYPTVNADREQLDFAVARRRAPVEFTVADFVREARGYAQEGRHHCGIVVSAQLEIDEPVRRMTKVLGSYSASDMINRFVWLQEPLAACRHHIEPAATISLRISIRRQYPVP